VERYIATQVYILIVFQIVLGEGIQIEKPKEAQRVSYGTRIQGRRMNEKLLHEIGNYMVNAR
jgi:hypothetical protein